MGKTIGKVLATEKNPSTMEEFYFWTSPKLVLNPFDVVKVDHINDSVTYGVVEEISHITANSHFPRPAGPHFPASQGHIKRSALEIGRARGAPPC